MYLMCDENAESFVAKYEIIRDQLCSSAVVRGCFAEHHWRKQVIGFFMGFLLFFTKGKNLPCLVIDPQPGESIIWLRGYVPLLGWRKVIDSSVGAWIMRNQAERMEEIKRIFELNYQFQAFGTANPHQGP